MNDLAQHIRAAVRFAGSQAKLAERIGCSQQHISYMIKVGRVSAEAALAIEVATGGCVPKALLRPDIFQPPEDAA